MLSVHVWLLHYVLALWLFPVFCLWFLFLFSLLLEDKFWWDCVHLKEKKIADETIGNCWKIFSRSATTTKTTRMFSYHCFPFHLLAGLSSLYLISCCSLDTSDNYRESMVFQQGQGCRTLENTFSATDLPSRCTSKVFGSLALVSMINDCFKVVWTIFHESLVALKELKAKVEKSMP